MDTLAQNGIGWILAFQSLGTWLEPLMEFFTFLGYEDFFFIVLPLVYWSIDAGLGLRIAFILSTSNYLNAIVKMLFATPRPYWVSAEVEPYSMESTFGTPSGHAQNAVAIWGIMAAWLKRPWAWVVALTLAFLIGLSRLYLGVHFPHDILVGWLLGLFLLFIFLWFWAPVAAWLKQKTFGQQVALAFVISFLMVVIGLLATLPLSAYVFPVEWTDNALRAGPVPDPVSIEGILTSAGAFFGLAVGAAWINVRGGYQTSGSLRKRVLRYIIGLVGVIIFWYGLGEVFPRGETFVPLFLRYIRYTLVGFWVTAGAPWLFFHFKLADQPKI